MEIHQTIVQSLSTLPTAGAGMDDFLAKPIRAADFAAMIAAHERPLVAP